MSWVFLISSHNYECRHSYHSWSKKQRQPEHRQNWPTWQKLHVMPTLKSLNFLSSCLRCTEGISRTCSICGIRSQWTVLQVSGCLCTDFFSKLKRLVTKVLQPCLCSELALCVQNKAREATAWSQTWPADKRDHRCLFSQFNITCHWYASTGICLPANLSPCEWC